MTTPLALAEVASASTSTASGDQLAAHRLHLLLLLALWLVVLVAWQVTEHRRRRALERGVQVEPLLPGLRCTGLALVAAATAGGGLVHLAVTPEHFDESTTYGVFFLVLGLLQIAWSGVLLVRPSAALLRLGGAVSAGVVLLWLDTRFVGIGLGPLQAGREAFGAVDMVATGFELWVIVYALRHARALPPSATTNRPPITPLSHDAAHGST